MDSPFHASVGNGRRFIVRLPAGEDLLAAIDDFCSREGIRAGAFSLAGHLAKATLGIFDSRQQVHVTQCRTESLEIASGGGTVLQKEGRPHVWARAVLVTLEGKTLAGTLFPGTRVFAGEMDFQELIGDIPARADDPETGLPLLNRP